MEVCLFADVLRKRLFYVLLILVAGFWYFVYPHHVLYQESFNLFLYTSSFFERYVLKPGGWGDYAGLFFMQFFRYLGIGILLNVLALLLVYKSVTLIFRQWGIFRNGLIEAWLPALGLFGLQMNYDFHFSETLKVVLFFASLAFLGGRESKKWEILLALMISPVLLLLLGGGMYILFYLLWFAGKIRRKSPDLKIKLLAGVLIFPALLLWFWRAVYLMPATQLYEFFPDTSRVRVIFLGRLLFYGFVCILLTGCFLSESGTKRFRVRGCLTLMSLGLLAGCIWGLWKYNYRPGVESLLHAELAVAGENWQDMQQLGEEAHYEIPTFVALTNLALAKQGLLADRMLNYPQAGLEGLILPAGANYLVNLYGHEIYYQLGQNNEAYRYLFEAYNCKGGQVSGHVLKRMAELLIRLDRPKAAAQILYQLKNSLFYRRWAGNKLQDLTHFMPGPSSGGEDFYPGFSGTMVDLIHMVRQDPSNKMLREYLLTACLLEKQLPAFYHFFVEFYPEGKTVRLPRMYEEALLIIQQSGQDKAVLEKYKISGERLHEMKDYTYAFKRLMKNPEASRLMYDAFGNTYWYYMHFKKKNS